MIYGLGLVQRTDHKHAINNPSTSGSIINKLTVALILHGSLLGTSVKCDTVVLTGSDCAANPHGTSLPLVVFDRITGDAQSFHSSIFFQLLFNIMLGLFIFN